MSKRRPRLLYLHNRAPGESLANQVQVLEMCRALQEAGFDITLALPKGRLSQEEAREAVAIELGEPVKFQIEFWNRGPGWLVSSSARSYFGLKRANIAWREYDYVFVRFVPFLGLAIRSGAKVVFERHAVRIFTRFDLLNRLARGAFVRLTRKERLTLFISVSHALRDHWVRKGVPAEKSVALHDGVRDSEITRPGDRIPSRESLGLPTSGRIATYSGSLGADRHPGRLIQLARDLPDVTICVVGGTLEQLKKISGDSDTFPTNLRAVGRVHHSRVSD